jgi:GNAT superfamily N-acetyltransferase
MEKKLICIRDAQENEHDVIREVITKAYTEFEAVLSPSQWALYQENIVATLEEKRPIKFIVAVQDETIVGSILLYPSTITTTYPGNTTNMNWSEVRLLAVLPEMRGLGIATKLIHECIQRAQRAGESALGLHTADFMRSAIRLYEQNGFVRAPEADFYGGDVHVFGYRFPLNVPSKSIE